MSLLSESSLNLSVFPSSRALKILENAAARAYAEAAEARPRRMPCLPTSRPWALSFSLSLSLSLSPSLPLSSLLSPSLSLSPPPSLSSLLSPSLSPLSPMSLFLSLRVRARKGGGPACRTSLRQRPLCGFPGGERLPVRLFPSRPRSITSYHVPRSDTFQHVPGPSRPTTSPVRHVPSHPGPSRPVTFPGSSRSGPSHPSPPRPTHSPPPHTRAHASTLHGSRAAKCRPSRGARGRRRRAHLKPKSDRVNPTA